MHKNEGLCVKPVQKKESERGRNERRQDQGRGLVLRRLLGSLSPLTKALCDCRNGV